MSKAEFIPKPSEENEAFKKNANKVVTETREAIDYAMKIADLQMELYNLDMEKMTPEKVESFFAQYGEDPIAKRLKERMLCILKFRNDLNDKEILKAIFGIKPLGPVGIQATPISISMDFWHPIDWAKVAFKGKSVFPGIWEFLFPKGESTTQDFIVKDKHNDAKEGCRINVDYHRAYGIVSLHRIKQHEFRHSMNREVSDMGYTHWAWEEHFSENDEKLTEIIIEDLANACLVRLKNELSAFIIAGNKSKFTLKYLIFLFGPLVGKYDFKRQGSDFWDFWRKKGLRKSVIKRVKKELPKRIDITTTLERSYRAVKLLKSKGYSHEWAVSFLCVGDNLLKDWLTLAEACPPATTPSA